MARRFNELFNYLLVLFLIYPSPVLAEETTTYERISDTGQNTTDISFDYGGSSWNRLDIHSGQCGSNNQAVHYNMQNLDDQTITITFPEDNITTAGFLSGCVNDPYPITWTYSDGTTETVNYSAQSNADVATMYEVVSKSVTGKYITSVAIEYDDYVILDDIFWTFDNTPATTTTTSTTTTSTTTTSTTTTTTTVPPTTTTTSTTTTTTTTTVPPTTTTTTVPITAPNAPTNVSVNYGGEDVYFSWEYEAGEIEVLEFHINYSYDNQTWTRVVIDDTTARTYTLDKSFIQTGTFYWEIASCGDLENNQSCANGDSNSFETTEYVPPTTTTIPPAPEPEPEPEIVLPPEPIQIVVIMEDGSEAEYEEHEIEDGTVERDNERKANEDMWGCYITDIALFRGDCPAYNDSLLENTEEDIIIEYEEESDTEGEFFDDDDMVFELELEDEGIEFEEEFVELSEEEILELEEQMEIDAKKLELEADFEIFEFESEEDAEEFIKTIIELEEINFEEEFGIEEEVFELEIDLEDVIIIIEDEIIEEEIIDEIIEDEILEEDVELDRTRDVVLPEKEVIEEPIEEEVELTEEEIEEEVAELEEVIEEIIVLDIPEVSEEELEELSEEELIEYEEAKEEAIEEYVEELETEEVVEILEEVNDVGVENLESASEEVIEVVAKVVEEVIQIASEEVLTDEQAEVVGEVLGFDEETAKEDVQIIAEQAQEDEVIAEAVEVFVERAVENADSTALPYTLADVVVEIQFEEFVADPIGAIIDIDLQDIKISEIGADLTTDQKEKAQEVIVPTLLLRVASLAFTRRDL